MRQLPELSAVSSPAPTAWLDVQLPTVEENLALDEALLDLAHEGLKTGGCVRTWMADEPVVVLGSSCRSGEDVDAAACEAAGVRIVRRPSGGGTVVLGPGCLMWSVIVAYPEGSPPIEPIHASMLEPLAAGINAAISAADQGSRRRVARRGTSDLAIFEMADDGTVVGERKVSGNALRVRRHGVLYHGTLLDDFDLGLVGRVLRHPPREPDYRSRRSHGEFLANLGLGREPLERIVRAAFHATTLAASQQDWPRDRVARLVAERYASTEWTGRL